MVGRLAKIAGMFMVLAVMLPGASLAANPAGTPDEGPTIIYPAVNHPYKELACAPTCPGWILVTPMPSTGGGAGLDSMAPTGSSSTSSPSRGADLFGPATSTSKAGIGAPSGGFMAYSAGAGHPSTEARAEKIRSELKSTLDQLGL